MKRVLPVGVSLCPRCGGYIPNDERPGEYPGAMSRTDNKTEICSKCGTDEAIEEMLGCLKWQNEWKINKVFDPFGPDAREMLLAEEESKKIVISPCAHNSIEPLDCDDCRLDGVECNAVICVECSDIIED